MVLHVFGLAILSGVMVWLGTSSIFMGLAAWSAVTAIVYSVIQTEIEISRTIASVGKETRRAIEKSR